MRPTPSVRSQQSLASENSQRSATGTKQAVTSWQGNNQSKSFGSAAHRTSRRSVPFTYSYPPGSIVVVNRERALYLVGDDYTAARYPVAIGTIDEEWSGIEFVTDKKVYPTWYPVVEIGRPIREPVRGGDPSNSLGARALYLGNTLWRIHGTPAAESIGQNVSNGCIRMHNEHVVELYERVMLGTEVYVVDALSDPLPTYRGRKVSASANIISR